LKQKRQINSLTVVIWILTALLIGAVAILIINLASHGYDWYQRYTHPIKFGESVGKFADEHGLDRFLVYAVIKTESGFNPNAVSNAGARGLMQIMPETFEWLRDYRFSREEAKFDIMFNPDDNIRYGVYLIAYHMRQFDNNIDNSLAAYHAGDGDVKRWLNDKQYSSDGKTLDKIPISQTAHYVNKVNKAYETYLKLYGS